MSGIKALADELRMRIRQQEESLRENGGSGKNASPEPGKDKSQGKKRLSGPSLTKCHVAPKSTPDTSDDIERLLGEMKAFPNGGNEKLLVRLDGRDIQFLKQLKLVSGIDMIQVIAFALDTFLKTNPGLREHIKRSLLNELK